MPAYDVVVAGGGNAGLCAAIAARSQGASVLLVERAPWEWRGGNSKYTRNVRVAHDDSDEVMPGVYTPDELVADLESVTGPDLDVDLAHFLAERSTELPAWMSENGIRWQGPLKGTLQLARTNRFFLGGGKALVNTYNRRAEALGVDIRYDTSVVEVVLVDGRCVAVVVDTAEGSERIDTRAFVAASGGFEANFDWLREYWGDRVDNYVVRGTAYNDGSLIRHLLELGARSHGNPRGHHAIAVDARSPRYDGGIVTRVDSIPFSIVVNADAERFADEGEDLWPMRYATWGGLIGEQPGQKVYSIYDSKVVGQFIGGAYQPIVARSIADLAREVGLPEERLVETVDHFNRSTNGHVFDPTIRDGCATEGLTPPKSNWALPVDAPPYYCFPLVPGLTFTYLAVEVDRGARVVSTSGTPFPNVFAAGEVMAGNILLRGYLAGIGMTIGSVFGIIAGREAAVCGDG